MHTDSFKMSKRCILCYAFSNKKKKDQFQIQWFHFSIMRRNVDEAYYDPMCNRLSEIKRNKWCDI